MKSGAALSLHPIPSVAVGEVVGELLENDVVAPELAVLFVSAGHTGAVEDIVRTVRTVLRPKVLVGGTAGTVVGGPKEVEDAPAVSLWAGSAGRAIPLRLLASRLDAPPLGEGTAITGFPAPDELPVDAAAVLVLADPFSFPVEAFLTGLRERYDLDLPVVGGFASAARGPGGNRLVLDDAVVTDGAVAVVLAGVEVATVVSQGCRPVGEPMTVTAGEGQLIAELAGRPALDRLQETLQHLDDTERQLVQSGLHVGRVIEEHAVDYGRGDFLIRGVLGADRARRAVAVGDVVEVGSTVQFQVRDAATADEDLRSLMAGRSADTALLFTCNGRGTGLFGQPDHDAGVIDDALGSVPLAGMSCAGELGPVGGRNFLHGFTASVVLFTES